MIRIYLNMYGLACLLPGCCIFFSLILPLLLIWLGVYVCVRLRMRNREKNLNNKLSHLLYHGFNECVLQERVAESYRPSIGSLLLSVCVSVRFERTKAKNEIKQRRDKKKPPAAAAEEAEEKIDTNAK